MKKRVGVMALLIGLTITGALAGQGRDADLRKYVGDGSEAARQARLGRIYSSACNCTQGVRLKGTDGMVFNCSCGTMQCVVVANTRQSGAGQTPNLVCR